MVLIAGTTAFLGGWRLLLWALPSISFLWFMIPLPWRVERLLSGPLQQAVAKLSCWALQCLGQPALSEGNVILLNEHQLEVAQACSGLRIFMGIVALAFAYLVIFRRTWWEKLLLLLCVLPIALAANSIRIVTTGLLYQFTSTELAQKFSHDFAGALMIPLAALLFAAVLWYVDHLFRETEQLDVGELLRR